MKLKYIIFTILILSTQLLFANPPKKYFLEIPKCENCEDHQIRVFNNYSICYRESYEQAEWSAYHIDSNNLTKTVKRSDDFRSDPSIITGSASPLDYLKSGYDKGHLTPAADMSFGDIAMSETFYMSNMSPQAPGFNRIIWKNLENQVRNWCIKFNSIYVVSGPVLDKPAEEFEYIGKNKVSVPEKFYKTILVIDEYDDIHTIAFVIPNKKCDSDFWEYMKTVDEVEELTGIDFYYSLDDNIEDDVESVINIEFWK